MITFFAKDVRGKVCDFVVSSSREVAFMANVLETCPSVVRFQVAQAGIERPLLPVDFGFGGYEKWVERIEGEAAA